MLTVTPRFPRTLCMVGFLAITVASACADDDDDDTCEDSVATRVLPGVDFSTFQTFALLPADSYPDDVPDDLPDDIETDLLVAGAAAKSNLLELGLTEVDFAATPEPDLVVFNVAGSSGETGTVWTCVPGYVWWGWYWYWDPCAWYEAVPVEYTVGTVVVGLADGVNRETGQVVFGGAVQGVLECGDTQARLEAGVNSIFDAYPTVE